MRPKSLLNGNLRETGSAVHPGVSQEILHLEEELGTIGSVDATGVRVSIRIVRVTILRVTEIIPDTPGVKSA